MNWISSIRKYVLRTPSHLERVTDEQGNVLLLVAFSMLAIIGVSALVVDVGYIYLQQSRMQAAVDAGALAGAQAYIHSGRNGIVATTTALQVAQQNSPQYTYQVPAFQNNEVVVTARESVPLWFAKVWGMKAQQVQVTGRAQVAGLAAPSAGVVPIGVQLNNLEDDHHNVDFQYNKLYTLAREGDDGKIPFVYMDLWDKTGSGGEGDSNSQGANLLGQYIHDGYKGPVKVGDSVKTLEGEKVGKVDSAIDYRSTSSQDVACQSYQTATAACSQVLLLPVVSSTEDGGGGDGHHSSTIVGFVSFYILSPNQLNQGSSQGNKDGDGNGDGNGYGNGEGGDDGHAQFTGYFLQIAQPGLADTSGTVPDLGTYTAQLIH